MSFFIKSPQIFYQISTSYGVHIILKERETATSISVLDCPFAVFTNEETRLKSILSQISKAKTELINLKSLLEEEEKRIIDASINGLDLLKQKYEKIKSGIVTQLSLINCINNAFNDYNKVKTLIKTTADQNLETFIQQEKNLH